MLLPIASTLFFNRLAYIKMYKVEQRGSIENHLSLAAVRRYTSLKWTRPILRA